MDNDDPGDAEGSKTFESTTYLAEGGLQVEVGVTGESFDLQAEQVHKEQEVLEECEQAPIVTPPQRLETHENAKNINSNGNDIHEYEQTKNEEESLESWKRHKKHILIFSTAGKPIFSRYGNEWKLSSMFSLLQAVAAKMSDKLKVVKTKTEVFVFVKRGPIYLVAISKTKEPVFYIEKQLDYLHSYILFHFTASALIDTFKRKPGYDLRELWGGTESEVRGLIKVAHYTPSILLDAVGSVRLPCEIRSAATDILHQVYQPNLIYAILLVEDRVICTICPKRYPLISSDLVLIVNFVQNSRQLKSQETWTPLCLPAFNNTGFLHAYASYISSKMSLILLSSGESLEQFHYCSTQKVRIQEELAERGIIRRIEEEFAKSRPSPSECEAAACIHLTYKCSRTDQYFETSISSHAPLFADMSSRKSLLRRYAQVYSKLYTFCRRRPEQNESYVWDKRLNNAVFAVAGSAYEVFATFHPTATCSQADTTCKRFIAWMKQEAENIFPPKRGVFW